MIMYDYAKPIKRRKEDRKGTICLWLVFIIILTAGNIEGVPL